MRRYPVQPGEALIGSFGRKICGRGVSFAIARTFRIGSSGGSPSARSSFPVRLAGFPPFFLINLRIRSAQLSDFSVARATDKRELLDRKGKSPVNPRKAISRSTSDFSIFNFIPSFEQNKLKVCKAGSSRSSGIVAPESSKKHKSGTPNIFVEI